MAFSFMNNFDQTLSNLASRCSVDEIRFNTVNLHGALYYRCTVACDDDSEYHGGSRTSVFEAFQSAVEKYKEDH